MRCGLGGWSVFWDPTIRAGGYLARDDRGVELQSARCALVLWSRNSIKSRWVQEEAEEAKMRGILVPVLIDHILPPLGFRSVHFADLSNWDGTEETPTFLGLISDIVALIGPSPKEVEEERRRQEATDVARRAEEERQRAIASIAIVATLKRIADTAKASSNRRQSISAPT